MEPRALPGFYFDPEKNKYFKIVPDHQANVSKYTRSYVEKAEQNAKKRKRDDARAERLKKTTVQRSRHLGPANIGRVFFHELGYNSRRATISDRTSLWAADLSQSQQGTAEKCSSCGRSETVYDFAIDPATKNPAWAVGQGSSGRLESREPSDKPGITLINSYAAFSAEISSVSITHDRTIVATALDSNYPGNVFVSKLPSREDDDYYETSSAPFYLWLGDEMTIWTTSPSPAGGPQRVAIGHDEGVHMITSDGRVVGKLKSSSDVRALDWLNSNVTIAGDRNGTVKLWDIRSGGSSARFSRSGPITGIRSLDNGNEILTTGVASMEIFDLRMSKHPRSAVESQQRRRLKKLRGKKAKRQDGVSKPLLEYKCSTDNPSAAVDVWPEAQMLAWRTKDNSIDLHSLRDLRPFRTLKPLTPVDAVGDPEEDQSIRRLRFTEDRRGLPRLMYCKGSMIGQFSYDMVKDEGRNTLGIDEEDDEENDDEEDDDTYIELDHEFDYDDESGNEDDSSDSDESL